MRSIEAQPYPWPHTQDLAPATTAFIIIDMQRDFCDPAGYIGQMGYDIGPARKVIPRIVALRAALREWGAFVLYTREGHRRDLSDLPRQKRFRSQLAGGEIGSTGTLGRLLVRGEPGWEIVDELTPAPMEPVVDKPGFSAFYATDLDHILTVRGVRHIIICGLTTDVCVHSTMREAVDRGYETLLLSDCSSATQEANHVSALSTVRSEGGIFGAVATSEDVMEFISSDQL